MSTYFYTKEFLTELESKYREAGNVATADVIHRSIARARGRKSEPETENGEKK